VRTRRKRGRMAELNQVGGEIRFARSRRFFETQTSFSRTDRDFLIRAENCIRFVRT